MRNTIDGVTRLFTHEAAGGLVLLLAAVVALIAANTPAVTLYDQIVGTPLSLGTGPFTIDKPLLFWINDGLMAVFFFLVGLEIKRELLVGALSSPARASLPAFAALGGMIAPALVYLAITRSLPAAHPGWGIPVATDIAFALGVLALLGPRVPPALKIFLLALAIIDDLGAILIIALFYTENLSVTALALAGVAGVGLYGLNRTAVGRLAPYLLVGLVMWVCVLKSGVHATLAGVATALAVPIESATGEAGRAEGNSLLERTENWLNPWVTFAVLPLFAFANAGVPLANLNRETLFGLIPLGIALGLVIGKPVGILAFTWLAIRFRWGERPDGVTWAQLAGVAMLGGIGFTMSLFIGMLAFPSVAQAAELRIGVLLGSLVAAVLGSAVLALALPKTGR